MIPQHIGKTSEREMNELAEESYRQITGQNPMTPQPQQDRCVLTRHDVQSIKDLVFVVGGNSESSAQKTIFEILANNMRRSRPAPSPERIGSIRINIFMDEQKEWLIERVNAGMGEWEYVISYLGEYFATAPSESIAREIQEAYSDRSAIAAQAREDENKRIVKILEEYRFGLDYPDCPPGDVIKKLVESLRTEGGDE